MVKTDSMFMQTNVDSTVFTWIIRKLHVANALVLREDACIRRTCRYRTKSLLTSTEISTELRWVKNVLCLRQIASFKSSIVTT